MNLSIVIVSWNTSELLIQCLSSIYANPPNSNFETWVVDNASTDASVAQVKQLFPQVKLIENKTNIGFAKANNQAIMQCQGRYVLLLNPDTVVKPNALTALTTFLDAHSEVGAAGSMLLNPDETLQTSCYPMPNLRRELWRLLHLDAIKPYGTYNMAAWDLAAPREVDVIQGASLLLRKTALDQTGLLDDSYFIYTEEVDLCFRLQKAGWSLFWVPESRVIHYGGQSTKQVAVEMFLRLYESKIMFFRKHYGRLAAQAYKLILVIAAVARMLFCPLVLLAQPPRRQRYSSIIGNYRRLLTQLPRM